MVHLASATRHTHSAQAAAGRALASRLVARDVAHLRGKCVMCGGTLGRRGLKFCTQKLRRGGGISCQSYMQL